MIKIVNKSNVFLLVFAFICSFALSIVSQSVGATASGYVCSDGDYDPRESSQGAPSGITYAQLTGHEYGKCKDGSEPADTNKSSSTNDCGDFTTNIINCESSDGEGIENSGLWNLLLTVVNILSAGIGIAAVGGVVYAAVLYSSAGANPDNVKKAKEMFVNIGIGIVAYILMYSFLNYLIPGGLFN